MVVISAGCSLIFQSIDPSPPRENMTLKGYFYEINCSLIGMFPLEKNLKILKEKLETEKENNADGAPSFCFLLVKNYFLCIEYFSWKIEDFRSLKIAKKKNEFENVKLITEKCILFWILELFLQKVLLISKVTICVFWKSWDVKKPVSRNKNKINRIQY